ncbi:MAG TPA: DUF4296 domain-containing protein [Bacteroidia bacterium]|nr:DUF4296 domain-containing protein [Bacteroidia bacterium]HRH06937.1 DUF4296 domain-containing protein [Bacteroidia bacterium]
MQNKIAGSKKKDENKGQKKATNFKQFNEILIHTFVIAYLSANYKVMQFIKKYLLVFSLLGFANSCTTNSDGLPDNLIGRDSMITVLIDIHIADAAVNLSSFNQQELPPDKEKLFREIYSKHGLTKAKFDSSFIYYSQHPELFEKIYEDVIIGLSKRQAELSK